jgi:hypothetical protein
MSRKQHFQRNGGGVFRCEVCDRSTRRVDQGHDSRLCPQCWDLAGLDNTVNDNGPTEPSLGDWTTYRDALLADAVAKGGNAEQIKKEFTYLWGGGA